MAGQHDSLKLLVNKDQNGSRKKERADYQDVSGDLKHFQMLGKLEDETRKIQSEFSDLLDTLIRDLEHRRVAPEQVIDALGAYLPDECLKASQWDELFDNLLPHMSFFNYDIISVIIKHVGGALVEELAAYEDHFESYSKNRVSGPHRVVRFTNEAQNNFEFMEKLFVKLDLEWEQVSLEDLKRFQCKLASILKIRQEKLILQSIQQGCVLVTFLIHTSLLQIIMNNGLNTDQEDSFNSENVISLTTTSAKVFENMELLLLRSSRKGQLDLVTELIDRGVDVNALQDGRSALMLACRHGHFKIVKVLLENQAFVGITDQTGTTPLMIACQKGYIDAVKILHVYHADVNKKDMSGWSSLMYAVKFNHLNIVQFLVEHKAELDAQNENNISALHVASQYGYYKILELLLDAGATVDIQDKDEDTPLIHACYAGHTRIAALLLKNRANPNTPSRCGLTPLMYAVKSDSVEVVKMLLYSGAHTCAKEPETDWTALFYAAKFGHLEIIKLLLNSGADIDVKDKDGTTPLKVAQDNGHDQLYLELEKESKKDLRQSENFQNVPKLTTDWYIHQFLEQNYQKTNKKSPKHTH